MRRKGIGRFTLNLSFSEAAGVYIENVNRKLSGPQCLGYGSRTNVVRIALDSLVSQQRFIDWGYLEYEEAEAAVRVAVRDYIDRPAEILRWLEEEDLIRVQGGHGSAYVHFSYERVGDCVAAEHLLREVSQVPDVLRQLKSDEWISAVISSNRHAGIVEALSVLVSERFGVEIFELFDEADKVKAAEYFISSLSWRSPSEVADVTAEYVRDIILPNPGLLVALITKLIAVSMSPNNAFNACYLHRLLKEMDPAARDAVWFRALLRSGRIEQTIDWVWRNVGSIPESAIWPVELLLCWCLASSSRNIRDVATKALSCCLIAAPEKAEDLLGEFLACQDDYVVERLLASIYGAASHSQDASTWFVAAKKIYGFVYEGAETYPNVMIRNYSDCLADHISKLMDLDENAFPLSRSRGTSSWYPQEVSNEHIDAQLEETKQKYGENSEEAYNLWWLIHSMTTEYGRGTSAYGDFGRYVFGSRVHCWDNQFEIDQKLANLALWEILENRYVPELHCAFDREVGHYEQGRGRGFERITKKYQWIEMHRMIARLLDNYPPYREEVLYDDEYNVYQKKRSALFMEAFRAKGGGYPSGVDLGPELDASEHVVSLTKIPLSAEEVFNDLAYIRDIDPTYLFPDAESATEVEWLIAGSLSALSGDDSFDEMTLKPVLDEVYTEERFGRSFTPLYAIVTKKNVSERTSEVHLNSGACFIKAADLVGFLEKYQGKNGNDIMSQSVHSIYTHEFCSGFALDMEQEFRLHEMPEEEKQAIPATMEYLWEPVEDGSLDGETACLQQPCKDFVDCLGLVQNPSGTWKSESGETVRINESTEEGNQMLVDHAWLKRYLSERELLLCRGEYFEISSPDECQRVWLVSAGNESAERTASLLKKEQYEID
jgi:hypothetical protein